MPVDPGNLLLIGNAGGVPVLGAPGCARSPVENGFDWVLMRLLGRPQGHPRRTHRHGRRRAADGNRDPAAAARAGRPGGQPQRRRGHSRRRALHPDGRSQQAVGRTRRQDAGADRDRAGAGLEGLQRRGRDRPSGRAGRAGAERPERDIRAQSGFRRGPRQLGEIRHRRGAAGCRRRGDLSRRHAADLGRPDRPADRDLRARSRQPDRGAGQRRQARQSGACGRAASSTN